VLLVVILNQVQAGEQCPGSGGEVAWESAA
jgi:hypothetical protein